MSLILNYQEGSDPASNTELPDVKVSINTPVENVSLPSIEGLQDASLQDVIPEAAVEPVAPPAEPVVAEPTEPLMEAPAPTEMPAESAPELPTPQLSIGEVEEREALPSESPWTVPSTGATLEAVGVQSLQKTRDQLIREGQQIQGSVDEAELLSNYLPSIYEVGVDDVRANSQYGSEVEGVLSRNAARREEELRMWQPRPVPQTETNPNVPRPDTTKPFNSGFGGMVGGALDWLGKQLGNTNNPFDLSKGQFGEAGNGPVGAALYALGLPQNMLFGAAADMKRAQEQLIKNLPGPLQDILEFSPLAAFERSSGINLPDPIQATPDGAGSAFLHSLRGGQYSLSEYEDAKSPVGLRQRGQGKWVDLEKKTIDPTFWAGFLGDIVLDPAGAVAAALQPLRKLGAVGKAVSTTANVISDPFGEAIGGVQRLRGRGATVLPGTPKQPQPNGGTPNPSRGVPDIEPPIPQVKTPRGTRPKTSQAEAQVNNKPVTSLPPGKVEVVEGEFVSTASVVSPPPVKSEVLQEAPTPLLPPAREVEPPKVSIPLLNGSTVTRIPRTGRTSSAILEAFGIKPRVALKAADEVVEPPSKLQAIDDGVVADTVEVKKAADAALLREEAELIRKVEKTPEGKNWNAKAEEDLIVKLTRDNKKQFNEELKAEKTRLKEAGQWNKEAEQQLLARLSQDNTTRFNEQLKAGRNNLKAKDLEAEPTVVAQQKKVEAVRQVAEQAVPDVEPSMMPKVGVNVFEAQMTAKELVTVLNDYVPGTQVSSASVKKQTRTLAQITALMKLVPGPNGKPLVSATRGNFKTYTEVQNYLQKQSIEDPAIYRLFEREGPPIPDELFNAPNFRIVMDEPKPFTPTPSVVVDNTVTRASQFDVVRPTTKPDKPRDVFEDVPLAKGATDVRIENVPGQSPIRVSKLEGFEPKAKAAKSKDFRGTLIKERDKLKDMLDETEDMAEAEDILKKIDEIDQELSSPNFKENPAHLEQLQREVIPDTQHGTTPEVISLTETKIQLEQELVDTGRTVQTLELEVAAQEEALETILSTIDNTADVGRRELAVDYVPELKNFPDDLFDRPQNIETINSAGHKYLVDSADIEEFANVKPVLDKALDGYGLTSIDIVYVTKNMAEDLSMADITRVKDMLADTGVAAFADQRTRRMYVKPQFNDLDEAKKLHVLRHEAGHIIQSRYKGGIGEFRKNWDTAMGESGGQGVTKYAQSFAKGAEKVDEDFAESVSLYSKNPFKFAEQFPQRARAVREMLAVERADALNSRTVFHGTRVREWSPNHDPLLGGKRAEWGQGVYFSLDPSVAATAAKADVSVNLPEVSTRQFGEPTVHEVKLSIQRPLNANDIISPDVQRVFSDAFEDSIGDDPQLKKAFKAFSKLTLPGEKNGKTIYPGKKVGEMWALIDKQVIKYMGEAGADVPEELLSDIHRRINTYFRNEGFDSISDGTTVSLLDGNKATRLSTEALGDTDPIDVAVARFNIDSDVAARNPSSPTAQVAFMESNAKLQSELLEQSKRKLDEARKKQFQTVEKLERIDDELTQVAKAEQSAKQLQKQRADAAANAEKTKRLNKQVSPCEF